MTTLIGPKRAYKQETLISPTYLKGQGYQKHSARMNNLPRNGDFWVTLRSLGVYEGYFEVVWIYEGYFGVIVVHFQKTLVSAIDFNDFMQTARYYRASES